jgi:hypothetical protein
MSLRSSEIRLNKYGEQLDPHRSALRAGMTPEVARAALGGRAAVSALRPAAASPTAEPAEEAVANLSKVFDSLSVKSPSS